jgi:hypothetical protein
MTVKFERDLIAVFQRVHMLNGLPRSNGLRKGIPTDVWWRFIILRRTRDFLRSVHGKMPILIVLRPLYIEQFTQGSAQ